MPKARTIRGLAHDDVVDHSMSAFGYLHPHVAQYARKARLATVTIDLIGSSAISSSAVPSPLTVAADGLQRWFVTTLNAYGFGISDVAAADLTLGEFGVDEHSCGATARIALRSGRVFEYRRGWSPANVREEVTRGLTRR